MFRMAATYIAVSGGELNVKEKIFMAFAWLPKAAVQVGTLKRDNGKIVNSGGNWARLP